MKQLSFDPQENVGLILSSVKSFWEEDVRGFVLKNVRRNVEWMLGVESRQAVGAGQFHSYERDCKENPGGEPEGLPQYSRPKGLIPISIFRAIDLDS